MGPAPAVATVRAAVRVALGGLPGLTRGTSAGSPLVLVACSGGADSLALAAATAFEAPRAGVRAGLITVDHGLQHESAAQAHSVAALGRSLGLDPVEILPVTVGRHGGPEAAARVARYAALDDAARRHGARVLLGHTLDDQAETVLLGLGRGSGPRSIAAMPTVSGAYLRPMLGVRRATTEAACTALGLAPWHDPHNDDPSFTRVRLRREVLPLLADVLQGGVAEALARTADLLRDDLAALDIWAQDAHAAALSPAGELRVAALAGLPRAVRTRVLRAWAHAAGAQPLSAERTAALDALVSGWHGQEPIHLPGGIGVRRRSETLTASPLAAQADSAPAHPHAQESP